MLARNIGFGVIQEVPSYFRALVAELVDNHCNGLLGASDLALTAKFDRNLHDVTRDSM